MICKTESSHLYFGCNADKSSSYYSIQKKQEDRQKLLKAVWTSRQTCINIHQNITVQSKASTI